MEYFEHGRSPNRAHSVALVTAAQLMDMMQSRQDSLGCCVISVLAGQIRCAAQWWLVAPIHLDRLIVIAAAQLCFVSAGCDDESVGALHLRCNRAEAAERFQAGVFHWDVHLRCVHRRVPKAGAA